MTKYFSKRRRSVLKIVAGGHVVISGLLSRPAFSQDTYPSRPITLIVGFAPGGSSDLLGRKLAQHLSAALGQPIIVQNKAGAGSTIAVRFVAEAAPDGYTLLLGGSSGMVIAPLMMPLPYDPVADFKTVAMIGRASSAIAVHPSVPAKTLPELVALVKANPGKYSYATAGIGGFDHLTGELFKLVCGNLDMLHIPYKGGAPAVQSVIAGQTPILMTTLAPAYPFVKTGQLRIITVTGLARSPAAPEIPTAIEQGFPDLISETANFLTLSSKTPTAVLEKLKAAMDTVMKNPTFLAELKSLQFDPAVGLTPEEVDGFVKTETEKWRKVAIKANVTQSTS